MNVKKISFGNFLRKLTYGSRFSKILEFVQPLPTNVKLQKSWSVIQVRLDFFSNGFHLHIILSIEQNISFGIKHSQRFNFGDT